MQTIDGFPRRNRIDHYTPAEHAIREAIQAVEHCGAHELLTDAVELLADAQNKVADFVELPDRERYEPRDAVIDNRIALTVWKDGTHKVWGGADANYAQADEDYLFTIGIGDLMEMVRAERLAQTNGESRTDPAPVAS